MRRFCLFVLLIGSLTGVLSAENWPNWRAPTSTGTTAEKGLRLFSFAYPSTALIFSGSPKKIR